MNRTRSKARSWTLLALYAWETNGSTGPLSAFLSSFISQRNIAPEAHDYILLLGETVGAHQAQIDAAVQRSLHNWRMERLSAIDRNVLRIGAAELLYLKEVPPRVAIQEAIVMAEKFGTAQSPRFVNGVLDALMRGATAAEAP